MRVLKELITKLGKNFNQSSIDSTPFSLEEVLTHLYNLTESITSNGTDLKNTFVLYAVKNNPNKRECEMFKSKFVKVTIQR